MATDHSIHSTIEGNPTLTKSIWDQLKQTTTFGPPVSTLQRFQPVLVIRDLTYRKKQGHVIFLPVL